MSKPVAKEVRLVFIMVVIQCYNTLIGRDNYILGKGGVLGQRKGSGWVWERLTSQLRWQHAKIDTLKREGVKGKQALRRGLGSCSAYKACQSMKKLVKRWCQKLSKTIRN